jgi:hypothetical protein
MQYRKLAIRVLVFSLCIAALAGIGVLVLPGASWIIAKLTGTAIATALTAALLLLSIKTLDGNQYKTFGSVLGLLVCFIYLCSVGAIWSDSIPQLRSWAITEKLAVTAGGTAGCGVLMLPLSHYFGSLFFVLGLSIIGCFISTLRRRVNILYIS